MKFLTKNIVLEVSVVGITANSTVASYQFSVDVVASGVTYTYSGTITATFTANTTPVTYHPFVITVNDSNGNIYYYKLPPQQLVLL